VIAAHGSVASLQQSARPDPGDGRKQEAWTKRQRLGSPLWREQPWTPAQKAHALNHALNYLRLGLPVYKEVERLSVQLWRSRQVIEMIALGEVLVKCQATDAVSSEFAAALVACSHWIAASERNRAQTIEVSVAVALDTIAGLVDATQLA